MSSPEFTPDDEGKAVVTVDGNEVGRVVEVQNGTAYADPDRGLPESALSRLGWSGGGETYALRAEDVASVTDDEVRLAGRP